ncbi:MAG TPA: histidine kinase [Thermoanaerobaculia bacterium]|nr:histidine kinase [Thermoanaerobaculia bacterium]
MNRTRLILIAAGVWTIIALYFASQAYFNPAFRMRPNWGEAVAINVVYYYIWGLITPLVIALARRFPFRPRRWPWSLAVHLVASVILTAIQIVAAEAVLRTFTTAVYRSGPFRESVTTAFSVNFHSSLPTYWLILAVYLAATYYRDASRLEAQLSRAELDALKMQLNPHFLFNTLNSISSLMYHDVDAAHAMLARLSELLRLTLERPPEQEIALEEEIEFVRRYLDIERIRFEERLRVDIDVERGAERALVPSLALQPLVENAIHHGIARRTAGGSIEIRARRDGESLHLLVRNECSDGLQPAENAHPHVGLANTRARLQSLYGARQRFAYGVRDGMFEVEMVIPCSAR